MKLLKNYSHLIAHKWRQFIFKLVDLVLLNNLAYDTAFIDSELKR